MALLVPIIGADKTREYFLDKFLELCTSEIYDVRKMCAVFNPHLCKVLGVDVSEKQLVSEKKLFQIFCCQTLGQNIQRTMCKM